MDFALVVALVALAVSNALLANELRRLRREAETWRQAYAQCYYGQAEDSQGAEPKQETPLPPTQGEVPAQLASEECPPRCLEYYEKYKRGEIKKGTLREAYRRLGCPPHCRRY